MTVLLRCFSRLEVVWSWRPRWGGVSWSSVSLHSAEVAWLCWIDILCITDNSFSSAYRASLLSHYCLTCTVTVVEGLAPSDAASLLWSNAGFCDLWTCCRSTLLWWSLLSPINYVMFSVHILMQLSEWQDLQLHWHALISSPCSV